MSHLPNKGPFVENKGNLKWSQRIISLTVDDISWYSRNYEDIKIILKYRHFPNVPLIGTKGGINYNPSMALCQLGYTILGKPDTEWSQEFVLHERVDNPDFLKRINRAWGEIHRQERDELGKNGIEKEA